MDTETAPPAPALSRRRKLWLLFSGFFKIATLVVGGGYAIVPVAEAEFVRRRKMLSETELLDMMAIIQSLPGIIAGNAALYIGFRTAGFLGALAALLGVATPSVVIIIVIAAFLKSFDLNQPVIQGAFIGAKAAITGLIALTAWRMAAKTVKSTFTLLLTVGGATATILFKVSPVWVILAGALLGVVYREAANRRRPGPDREPGP